MFWVALALGFGYLVFESSREHGGNMRQLQINGRSYTVFRLPPPDQGTFQVVSNTDPAVWISFDGTHEIEHNDGGDTAGLTTLRSDVQGVKGARLFS